MIYTSSYNDCQIDKYRTYSISGNRGKDANYQGKCYSKLAPKLSFWKIWHDNIGKISQEENDRYYVKEYWNQVLSKLDPYEEFRELDNSILLCYEPNTEFCHRHIVAAWFEILLEVKVPEIRIEDYQIVERERPAYIKKYLEDAMRSNRNMRGFESLRALYIYEKGEKLEIKTKELEEKIDESLSDYQQIAYFLKYLANRIEEEYQKLKNPKEIVKSY